MAVFKAVKNGRLADAMLADGSIDPVKGDVAWEVNAHPGKVTKKPSGPSLPRDSVKAPKLSRRTAPKELEAQAKALGITPGNVPSYNDSTKLLQACKAQLAEIELAEKIGNLVNKADVNKAAFNLARLTRDAMLGIPDRLAAELAGLTDPTTIHAKLLAEIRAALVQIVEAPAP